MLKNREGSMSLLALLRAQSSIYMHVKKQRTGNSCSAQPRVRQHILSLRSCTGSRGNTDGRKVTVLRVLQEHSMGASGTGQSEQLSGRTHAWKWSQMYPIKQREPGPGPDIPQACAANQQYGGLASSPCYAHS